MRRAFRIVLHIRVVRLNPNRPEGAGLFPAVTRIPVLWYLYRCPFPTSYEGKTMGFGGTGRTRTGDQQLFSRYTVIFAKALPSELLPHITAGNPTGGLCLLSAVNQEIG